MCGLPPPPRQLRPSRHPHTKERIKLKGSKYSSTERSEMAFDSQACLAVRASAAASAQASSVPTSAVDLSTGSTGSAMPGLPDRGPKGTHWRKNPCTVIAPEIRSGASMQSRAESEPKDLSAQICMYAQAIKREQHLPHVESVIKMGWKYIIFPIGFQLY